MDGAGAAEGIGDLPALEGAEADLVARFPLPDGVPDAIVNKFQLAQALDISQTTLDKYRHEDLPVLEAGSNGRGYRFRLSVCYAWVRRRRHDDLAARQTSEDAARQLRLALIGDDPSAERRAGLSPKEQRAILEAEVVYMQAARQRRELVPVEEVAAALTTVFAMMRDALDALPDQVARIAALDGRALEAVQAVCDETLDMARHEIAEWVGTEDDQRGDDTL